MTEKIIFEGITDEDENTKVQRIFKVSRAGNVALYPAPFEVKETGKAVTIVFANAFECDDEGNCIGESKIELAIVLPKKFIDILAVKNGSASMCNESW